MGLPIGYKYYENMALYLTRTLREAYIEDYGIDLQNRYDRADKTLYKERVFCLDCFDFKTCRKFWQGCPNRAKALRIMRNTLPLKSNRKEENE